VGIFISFLFLYFICGNFSKRTDWRKRRDGTNLHSSVVWIVRKLTGLLDLKGFLLPKYCANFRIILPLIE
jgi:hypothetical protein